MHRRLPSGAIDATMVYNREIRASPFHLLAIITEKSRTASSISEDTIFGCELKVNRDMSTSRATIVTALNERTNNHANLHNKRSFFLNFGLRNCSYLNFYHGS